MDMAYVILEAIRVTKVLIPVLSKFERTLTLTHDSDADAAAYLRRRRALSTQGNTRGRAATVHSASA